MLQTRLFRFGASVLAAAVVIGLAVGVYAQDLIKTLDVRYRNIQIKVDGNIVASDTEPFIVMSEERTYVGARALAEALGAEVTWDDADSTVVVTTKKDYSETANGDKTRYTNRRHAFRLDVPNTWLRLDNPSVATAYIDPLTGANVSVAVSPADVGTTLDQAASDILNSLRAVFKVTAATEPAAGIVAGQSGRTFTLTIDVNGTAVQQQLYVFLAKGNVYAVAFTAPASQFAGVQPTFAAITASLTLE